MLEPQPRKMPGTVEAERGGGRPVGESKITESDTRVGMCFDRNILPVVATDNALNVWIAVWFGG
jgi:hypothetical protein